MASNYYQDMELIGKNINNRYEVMYAIGRGAFGQVFRCKDLTNETTVALKLENVTTSRLKEEYKCYERLTGISGVPKVMEFFKYGQFEVLVMEQLGFSLGDLIRAKTLYDKDRVIIMARQLIITLRAIHKIGILHHDIKPDNIVMSRLGNEKRPYFIDFGIAVATGNQRWTSKLDMLDLGFAILSFVNGEIYQQILIDDEAKSQTLEKCKDFSQLANFFMYFFELKEDRPDYDFIIKLF